jgi:hypothetical protein
LLLPVSVNAAWTGFGVIVGQSESEWAVEDSIRIADIGYLGLRIEEKTQTDLRVGVSAGQLALSYKNPSDNQDREKFDGQFLAIYLRWPHKVSDSLSFHSHFKYRFNSTLQSEEELDTEIDWTELSLSLGVGLTLGRFQIQPLIEYRSLDGEVSLAGVTSDFENENDYRTGLKLDYTVEPYAYIRVQLFRGDDEQFQMSFVREY